MSDLLQYIGMQGPGNSFLYKKKNQQTDQDVWQRVTVGRSADFSISSAACCTPRRVRASPTGPNGRPMIKGVSRILGGAIFFSGCSNAATATPTVGMPDASASCAACPTDSWHSDQRGD
jgi:hypothetical protein